MLVTIIALLLSTHFYPIHKDDFGCFPCRCLQKEDGAKHLASCNLVGVLRLKDVSLSEQDITRVAEDAFTSSWGLQRLSLSGNRLSVLPQNVFALLESLQLLDLGRLSLKHVESETCGVRHVQRLVKLENLVAEPKPTEGVARRLAAPDASLGEILVGGQI